MADGFGGGRHGEGRRLADLAAIAAVALVWLSATHAVSHLRRRRFRPRSSLRLPAPPQVPLHLQPRHSRHKL